MGMWPFSGGSGRGGVAQNDAEGRAPHAASEFADEGADADLVAGYEGRLYVHPPPSQGYLPSQSRTSTSRSSSQQPVASTSGSSSSSSSDTENGDPRVSGHPALPMAEVGAANRKAQMRGTMDGIAGFVLSTLVTRKALRWTPDSAIWTGMALGIAVAYYSTWSHVKTGLRELEAARIGRGLGRDSRSGTDDAAKEMQRLDLRAGDTTAFEGGVAGLHDLHDRTHSTRGDH